MWMHPGSGWGKTFVIQKQQTSLLPFHDNEYMEMEVTDAACYLPTEARSNTTYAHHALQ